MNYIVFVICLCVGVPSSTQVAVSQVYNVSTLAGSTQGYLDGVGVNAKFYSPSGIALDNNGNIYVGDWLNCYIRKVSSFGVVTTLAGNGIPGYQNGIGTGAQFQYPNGVAVDVNGTVYVADRLNHRIRKITSSGVVTTLAGSGIAGFANGNGVSAKFYRPSDVTVDGNGNVYVADDFNHCIRKITSSGDVTTIAGNGTAGFADGMGVSARFNDPVNIAVDPNGNLYVTDYNNHRIRKITPDGNVTTIAGNGTAGYQDGVGVTTKFYLPTGLDVDYLGNVYVADRGNNRIRKITAAGVVTTIAGLGQGYVDGTNAVAQFNQPYSVSIDNAGNIYVVDTGNNRIRKITEIPTFPPSAVFGGTIFNEAVTNNGSVLTTYNITLANTTWSNTIPNGTTLTQGIHFSASNVPAGLTVVVTKVNASQATISFTGNAALHTALASVNNVQLTFTDAALNGAAASSVQGLNGINLSINFSDNASAVYSGTSFTESFANDGTVSTIRTVTLAFDTFAPTGVFTPNIHYRATGVPAGLAMTITRTSQTVAQIAFTGSAAAHENINDATIDLTFLNAAVASGNAAAVAGLTPKVLTIDFTDTQALGTAVYSDSTFIESASNNGSVNTVRTLTLNGDSFVGISTLVQGTHFTSSGVPSGLTLTITRTSPSTAQLSFSGSALAHANANDAVVTLTFLNAAFLSGNASGAIGLTPKRLFVDFADPTCGAVTTFAGNGNANVIDGTGIMASFADPRDVVTDAAGNVYVADKYCIRKITPAGVVTILAGSATVSGFVNGKGTAARFGSVWGLTLDAFGNIYAADESNAAIRKISPDGTVTTIAGGNGNGYKDGSVASATFYAPQDVAINAAGDIFVADFHNNAIRKISNGVVSTFNTTPITNGPANLVIDASGTLYVPGTNSNKIYKVSSTGAVSVVAGSGGTGKADGVGTSASFGGPFGVTIDTQGNLYIADYYPYSLIRKITPAGVVTTIAGNGLQGYADGLGTSATFNYPVSLALDAFGNLFISDRFNQRIRSVFVCGASGQFPLVATYSGTVFPEAIANNGTITTTQTITLAGTTWSSTVPDGAAFVAGTHFTATGVPTGLTLTITRLSATQASVSFTGAALAHALANNTNATLTFLNAAVASGNALAVTGLTPKTLSITFQNPTTEVVANVGYAPYHIARDAQGNFYVPQQGTRTVYKFAPQSSGPVQVLTGFTSTALLTGGIAIDSIGNIYVTTLANSIEKLAPGASISTTYYSSNLLSTPYGLDVDRQGNLYVASYGNASIVQVQSPTVANVLYQGAPLQHPIHAILDSDGHIVVADFGTNASGLGTGQLIKIYLCSSLAPRIIATGLNVPNGLTRTQEGRIFITNAIPSGILQYAEPQVLAATSGLGQLQTFPGSFNQPVHLGLDAAGNMFVTENVGRISRVSNSGELPIPLGSPAQLAVGTLSATQFAFPEAAVNNGTITKKDTLGISCSTFSSVDTLQRGVHYNVTNVPQGLTLVLKRTANGKIQISFAGAALAHESGNNTTATIQFLNPSITSGNGSQLPLVRLGITFLNSPVAIYSGSVFPEAAANDGSITTARTITLFNEQWSSAIGIGTVLVNGSHYIATNVPAGLTAVVTKISTTKATIAFTGNAAVHQSANSVNNVQITFTNAALSSLATSSVSGLNGVNLSVNFIDNAFASYSGTSFDEANANDGTVSTTRTVTLAFDTFVPTGVFTEGVHFTAAGVPAGLTLTVTRTSQSAAQIAFTGAAAAHESINNAAVTLTFLNAAVLSGNVAAVVGLTPKVLTVNFADVLIAGAAVYSDSTFIESALDNGTVNTTRTLTLSGATFVAVNNFVSGTHFIATGVPPGLTLTITRTSPTSAQLSFVGSAIAHANANDTFVTLTFLNAALSNTPVAGIVGLSPKKLLIDFIEPPCGTVTTFAGNGATAVVNGTGIAASFADPIAVATDRSGNLYVTDGGTVRKITSNGVVSTLTQSGGGNGIAIDGSGNIFTIEQTKINKITPAGVVSTVPISGLTLTNGSDIAVDAFGNLYISDGLNSIYKIGAFGVATKLNNQPVIASGIAVDPFGNVYAGGYNTNKVYKIAPNGNLTTIAGTGQAGYADGAGASAQFNQPVGITLDAAGNIYVVDYVGSRIRKITSDGVVSTVAGSGTVGYADGVGTNASFNYPLHIALDTAGNLFVTDRLNYRIRSINVCGASGQFPLAATYSGTVFPEAAANNGTITTTQTVTLFGATWSSAIANGGTFTPGTHYNLTGIPSGLTFSIVRESSTTAQLIFSGAAAAHANINDTSFVLTFLNAALANGSVAAVAGLTPKTLTIDFNDPPIGSSAAYSDVIFSEIQANNGQITTARTVTLTNASFASGAFVNGTHFTTSGVPDGLTLVVTRLSATQARLTFTGTAAAHSLANSADVSLTFLPAVLTGGNVASVVGLTPKTLRVNFLDPYTASYSDTTFAESIANDGTVPTLRTLTLVGVNFTTTATTLVQGTHFNVSGVPSGLTLTVTKTSSNVAQIAFSGAAAAHVVDVNNITLSFLNAALESGSGTAAAVTGLTPKKLSIDFIAPYTATYSAKNFVEGPANDGTVPTVRTLTLFGGDSFLPATLLQGAHFTATGVPSGLTMVMTRTSSTTAHISFTGTATNHANVNDASVAITFTPEALASGNPSAVIGLTPATLTIDFRDPDVTPPSSPNILGFTPQVGTTGTVVTISGFGFTGTQNVLFGGAPAKSFTVVSDSTITAVVDYGSTGDVTVVNAQGFAILPGFTYVPRPVISSFTPTTGNAGAVVTITGSNFQGTALNGTSWTTTSVYFGGTPATSFTVLSPTQIQATVGAGATGAVRVETLPGNVGVRNGFCYMAPLIAAFAPTSASTGTQVVIRCSNFTGATAVKFNGKAAASFAVVSDTEITAFPATGTPLTGSISVTTPQCTDDLATFTFIPAPIIYGFWLSGGTDGDVITIDGINFTGASGVKFGDMIAASYTVVSPTRIQAVVGSGNTGAVTVIGPGGVGSRSKFIYYAPGAGRPNPPIITSFTPTEGPDGTVITINGLNFQGADWYTTAVRIGDAPPVTSIIQSMTPTQLKVKVNGGNTGRITVYTPAGVTTSTMSFTYFPPPTISAFTPTTGAAGTTVTILGTEFTGVTSVKFGGVNAASYTVDSPTQITAAIGSGNTGKIQVVASGGTATSAMNFTLPTPPPVPTVTTFSPAIATTGTVITINGTNFTGATQVTFGGTPAQSFTVVNASRITAVVGGGASGSVAVTTPSGSASKTGFTYLPRPLPTITSFAPASASPGQMVTILGTYFTGATQVFMGSASVPFTVIHSGKITVEVPTNAASGVIRVVTPDGVALRSGFTFIPLFAAPPVAGMVAENQEAQESVSLGAFPNPASESVTLTGSGFAEGRLVSLTLVNALGQTVMTLTQQPIGGILRANVDVRDVPSGAYTVVLSDGVLQRAVRFVKR